MSFKDILGDGLKTDLTEKPPVYVGVVDPLVSAENKKSMEDNVV